MYLMSKEGLTLTKSQKSFLNFLKFIGVTNLEMLSDSLGANNDRLCCTLVFILRFWDDRAGYNKCSERLSLHNYL